MKKLNMKKWICLLAALALSAAMLMGKDALTCRALEAPPVETTATEPTQPEEELRPMEEKPDLREDEL